jgi:hypothetical protein
LTQTSEGQPIPDSLAQAGSVTFGGSHVLDLVARVANHAPKTAWYHKSLVHRRPRPEEADVASTTT